MSANKHQKEIKEPAVQQEKSAAEPEIQEIQEFVVSSEQARSERKKAEQASINAFVGLSGVQRSVAAVVLFAVVAVAYLMVGIRVCGIDVTVVCAVLVIQTAIGVLLGHNPVWLHICVAAADLIVGFCLNQVVLMAASMVVYVVAIVALEILQRTKMQRKEQENSQSIGENNGGQV